MAFELRLLANTLLLGFLEAEPVREGFLFELIDVLRAGARPGSTKLFTTGLTCLEDERLGRA